jgi:DNA polymerase-1
VTIALIDGDIVAYRAAAAGQKNIDWGDGETGPTLNATVARDNALRMVDQWREKAGCDRSIVCLSPRDRFTFRKVLVPDHKGNRKSIERPQLLDEIIDLLEAETETIRIPLLEADDVLGIMGTSEKFDSIIITIDKDLKTIPGVFYNPLKPEKPRRIREMEADHWWMTQTLTGDRVDGFSGCPGIGPAKAAAILDGARPTRSFWPLVRQTFERAGLTEDDAILQARLARILRRSDYDKNNQEITLWHPTSPTKFKLTDPRSSSSNPTDPPAAPS